MTASSWLSKTRAGPVKVRIEVVHARRLDDAAVLGEVAGEHGETAVAAIGMLDVTDTPFGAVEVQLRPASVLAEGHLRGYTAGRGEITDAGLLLGAAHDVPARQGSASVGLWTVRDIAVNQACAVQLAQDRDDAAGTVHVLHVVLLRRRRHLAQVRAPCGSTGRYRSIVKSTPASWAAASRCRTVLVDPPIAISRLIAFSNASKQATARGKTRSSS